MIQTDNTVINLSLTPSITISAHWTVMCLTAWINLVREAQSQQNCLLQRCNNKGCAVTHNPNQEISTYFDFAMQHKLLPFGKMRRQQLRCKPVLQKASWPMHVKSHDLQLRGTEITQL